MYNDELYHYGVIGMKWGKRKSVAYYNDQAKSHINKMNNSKTRIGKAYHNNKAYQNELRADVKKRVQGEKSAIKAIGDVYGSGGAAAQLRAASKYYDRKSTYTKTRYGTLQAKNAAYNDASFAKGYQKIHNTNSMSKRANAIVDLYSKTPVKTWSGRKTSAGRHIVESMLSYGIIPAVKDNRHYSSNKKAAKAVYKQEKRSAGNDKAKRAAAKERYRTSG